MLGKADVDQDAVETVDPFLFHDVRKCRKVVVVETDPGLCAFEFLTGVPYGVDVLVDTDQDA